MKMSDTKVIFKPKDLYKEVSPCLVCGEGLEYVGYGICDKCKRAILKVRREMEWQNGAHDDK
jgi:hypothetical protein